ncbi:DNA repair protein xrcc2 [Sorochytrium milnesiophthora]
MSAAAAAAAQVSRLEQSLAQILSRLRHRPPLPLFELDALDAPLRHVTHGLVGGDLIELYGAPGAGKSQLMYRLVLNRIVVREFVRGGRRVDAGGLDETVVVVDTDMRFDVRRVAQLVAAHLRDCCRGDDDDDGEVEEDVRTVTARCLDNLQICRPRDERQFLATLTHLARRQGLRYVFVDSLSAVVWPYKAVEYEVPGAFGEYLKLVTAQLRKMAQAGVTVVVSTWAVFPGQYNSSHQQQQQSQMREQQVWTDYIGPLWTKGVSYRFVVSERTVYPPAEGQHGRQDRISLCQLVYPTALPPRAIYIGRDSISDVQQRS